MVMPTSSIPKQCFLLVFTTLHLNNKYLYTKGTTDFFNFATMSTAISEALKTAMSKDSLTEIMRQNTVNVSVTYFGPFEPDVECLTELKAKASEE